MVWISKVLHRLVLKLLHSFSENLTSDPVVWVTDLKSAEIISRNACGINFKILGNFLLESSNSQTWVTTIPYMSSLIELYVANNNRSLQKKQKTNKHYIKNVAWMLHSTCSKQHFWCDIVGCPHERMGQTTLVLPGLSPFQRLQAVCTAAVGWILPFLTEVHAVLPHVVPWREGMWTQWFFYFLYVSRSDCFRLWTERFWWQSLKESWKMLFRTFWFSPFF